MVLPPLYGIDVVLDTARHAGRAGDEAPIDPSTDRVVSIGISLEGRDLLFDGDEVDVLADVEELLADLDPGVLVSWQGGLVDLPVLAARSRLLDVPTGLRLRRDVRDTRTSPVRGAPGGYCGAWHHHRHLDLARVYDPSGPRVIRALLNRDSDDLIPPTDELTSHDPRRDAQLARCLAERRWSKARRLVDRMPAPPGAPPAGAAPLLAAVRSRLIA